MKYCSVVYYWKGRGLTQEIDKLYRAGHDVVEWRGYLWTDFLEQMAREGWFLVTTAPMPESLDGEGIVAYFNRSS